MPAQSPSGQTRPVGAVAKPRFTPPPHPFFAIIAATPAVILRDRLYYLVAADTGGWFLQLEDARYGLAPAQTLAELADEYYQTYAAELAAAKNELIAAAVRQQAQTVAALRRQETEMDICRFLIYILIPYLQQVEHGRILHPPPAAAPSALTAPATPPVTPPARLLTAVLGSNSAILDGRLFPLLRQPASAPRPAIWIHKPWVYYHLTLPGRMLTKLSHDFSRRVAGQVQAQAAAELPAHQAYQEQLAAITRQTAVPLPPALVDGRDGTLYQGSHYAVSRQQGKWWVSTAVPAHIIEDASGNLYRFEATQVGIALTSLDTHHLLQAGAAVVMTAYEHPFVSQAAALSGICMVQPGGYYADLQNRSPAEAIVQLLHDARQTLLTGYHANNHSQPYHLPGSFPRRQVDRETAVASGLPIYPFHR